MEFRFDDSTLLECKKNPENDSNTYMIISKEQQIPQAEFDNIIQIIDEAGNSVSCTYDKFVEIFDTKGLGGFIY